MITFNKVFSMILILVAGSAFSQEPVESSSSSRYANIVSGMQWISSVGLLYGQFEQSGNIESAGDAIGARVIGTTYLADLNWLGDAGVGFQRLYLKNMEQPTIGILSASARYELASRWSLGPAVDYYLSNGRSLGAGGNQATFIGIVGYKEFLMRGDQLLRVGAKFASEVFVGHQASTYIGLTAEMTVGERSAY